jgi:hypothetical protein
MSVIIYRPAGRLAALCSLAAIVLGTASCGDVSRSGRSPAFLVIDQLTATSGANPAITGNTLQSDVVTNVSVTVDGKELLQPTIFEDSGLAVMYLLLKDNADPTNAAVPSTVNRMKITRYRVVYRRADGRNTPGVDVPYPFDGAITATITHSPSSVNFVLVRYQAKVEAPLRTLVGRPNAISAIADVTFYGEDLAGNAFEVTGSISINFADWGDPA